MPSNFNGYLWQHLYFWPHWSSQYFMQCPCMIPCTCSSCPYDHHSIGWPPISPSYHWMTTHLTIIPIGWPPISQSYHWMITHLTIIPIGWPPISQSYPLDDHPSHNHTHWMTTHLTIIQVIPCLHKDINGRPHLDIILMCNKKKVPHSHTNGDCQCI